MSDDTTVRRRIELERMLRETLAIWEDERSTPEIRKRAVMVVRELDARLARLSDEAPQ